MWELDCEESWVPKNGCFWTVVLEKTLESPLDCKQIQPVHHKGDQSWVFTGRTDAEAETPILWPPHANSWLIRKDPDAGRSWRQEEKGTTGDDMGEWHHQVNGHEFGWTPGVGDGQGGLVCCSSWSCKESDMTEPLNRTELNSFWPQEIQVKPIAAQQTNSCSNLPWCTQELPLFSHRNPSPQGCYLNAPWAPQTSVLFLWYQVLWVLPP